MRTIAMVLGVAACAGCTSAPAERPPFTFEVRVAPMPDDVTNVVVDGADQPFDYSEGVKAIVFQRTYTDYAEALASPQIEFEFVAGSATRNSGRAVPGVCAMLCTYQCPDVQHTELEHLDIDPLTDFTIFQFSCFRCEGGGKIGGGRS